eukprot:4503276-Pyramimonas_sp.AAC.1
MQEAWVYSRDGPIRCRKRGYILLTDQADTGNPTAGLDILHCRTDRGDLIKPSCHSREDSIIPPIRYGHRMSMLSPAR